MTLPRVFAWCVIVIAAAWAGGVIFGLVVLLRAWRDARNEVTADTAVTVTCKPCHGEAGSCTCSGKCGNWLCGADDTGISNEQFSRELRALLDREPPR